LRKTNSKRAAGATQQGRRGRVKRGISILLEVKPNIGNSCRQEKKKNIGRKIAAGAPASLGLIPGWGGRAENRKGERGLRQRRTSATGFEVTRMGGGSEVN